MRTSRLVLSCLLLHAVIELRAQSFQFSQYNFSIQRVNPASVGLSKNALVDFSYRNQKTGGDFQLNTNFLSIEYPFFSRSTGKPWSGLGLALLSDKSGLLFKSQEAAATYAINIPTGRNQVLSLGFKGLMRWQRINLDGLYTGSQYLEGHGFDPALDNGEVPKPFQNKYFTLSSGLIWQQTDRKGKLLKQFGFSFFDFNKPNPSFLDGSQDELSSTFIVHGAWRVYQDKKLGVLPELLLTRSTSTQILVAGGRAEYAINSDDRVDFLLKYAMGRSGIAGMQLHRQGFSIGLSYDFPMGQNTGNIGAFEVGLEYRTPVDPKTKRDVAKKKNVMKSPSARKKRKTPAKRNPPAQAKVPVKKPTVASFAVISPDSTQGVDQVVTQPIKSVEIEMTDTVSQRGSNPTTDASAGRISHDPLLIEKITLHFRFEYNSIDLDEETEKFMNELALTLKANPTLSIRVIGHTDNIGLAHHNYKLSLKRADVARIYLMRLGVEFDRILTEGRGMDDPLNQNLTEEERALNRRVEVKIFNNR
jgi:type IX secretion system PorP/SprF family membrane protein